ncbi:MAG: carboxymuconolactone decarboxylase family protein, partial [Verrucomicrobiota bacterium]
MAETMSYKDLNNETKALMQELGKQSPELMQAFQGLHQSATKSGALDTKTKELIALSLSVKAQCNRCIGMH